MDTRRLRTTSLVTVAALVGVLTFAGCSGGSDDDSGSDDAGSTADIGGGESEAAGAADEEAARSAADSDEAAAFGADQPDSSAASGGTDPAALTDVVVAQHLIKTGSVDMESDDVQRVVDRIYALARTSRGAVAAENTSTGEDGELAHARMEIRVPVATFDNAINQIKQLGTEAESNTETVDVTGKVANVDSRVRSAEQSIRQLRLLFDQATELGQIITLERELSRRQADLEALEAQQRALRSQTTMSTVVVTVRLAETEEKPAAEDDSQDGFVAGIKQGWDGFVTFVVGAGHALGLVLPFALLAIVVGGLGWVGSRRFLPHGKGAAVQSSGTSTD